MLAGKRLAIVVAIALGSIVSTIAPSAAAAANVRIVNQAALTYTDGNNDSFVSVSNALVATTVQVSADTLTPNNPACDPVADAVSAGRTFTKTFTLINGGNGADAFTASATASAGRVVSTAFTSNGNAVASPATIPAGGSLQVVVTVDATGVPIGNDIEVVATARSSGRGQNGTSTATATQCAVVATAAVLTGLTGSGSAIQKLVDGTPATQSQPGSVVSYSIGFRNSGDAPAIATVVADDVPVGVTPIASGATRDGKPLAPSAVTIHGQTIDLSVGDLAPHAATTIVFNATVANVTTPGTVTINVANVSASNIASARTSPAAVLVGSANIVFDGTIGAKLPIAGATVTLVDHGAVAKAATASSVVPDSTSNAAATGVSPYVTQSGGAYYFTLSPTSGAHDFDMITTAPSYVTRRIELKMTPDPTKSFFSVTATSLDGLPLTDPGTFLLTTKSVTIQATNGLFGNIPMFRTQEVVISKLVDRQTASAGDRLVYTIDVSNNGTPLGATTVTDPLPAGIRYAPGTGRVDGIPTEPTRIGSSLAWTLPTLAKQHVVTFAAVILPDVGESTTLTNVASVAAHVATSGTYVVTAQASATTDVIAGLFSNRTVITGRVYVDRDGLGVFRRGDVGVANVRVYLEDGESITTDQDGKFDFPSVRPGLHVLRLDETTLPPGVRAFDERRIDLERSTRRLVHDPFDGGLLQDVNFAVRDARS